MALKSKIIFLFSLLLFSLFPALSYSEEYRWDAITMANYPGWQVLNSRFALDKGSLVIASDTSPRIVSPVVNIPSSYSVLEIRLSSPADGVGALGIATSDGGIRTKYFTLFPGIRTYHVYIGDGADKGSVLGFAVEFHGGQGKEYRLDSISFPRPAPLALIGVFWEGFLEPDIIKVSTINSVTTPAFGPISLMVLLYVLVIVLALAPAVFRIRGGGTIDKDHVVRAVAVSFFIGAVAFAARMDYNWARFWAAENRTLSGKSEAERVKAVNGTEIGSFLEFLDNIKNDVPEGRSIAPAARPEGEEFATRARYYLLPLKTSSKPDYLWVYGDPDVSYDPEASALKKGGTVIASPVKPFKVYGTNSAVYELIR